MVLTFPPNLPLRKGGYKYSANLGSRLFLLWGQMQALAPATKKDSVCNPLPQSVHIRSDVGGINDIYFQRYSHVKEVYTLTDCLLLQIRVMVLAWQYFFIK